MSREEARTPERCLPSYSPTPVANGWLLVSGYSPTVRVAGEPTVSGESGSGHQETVGSQTSTSLQDWLRALENCNCQPAKCPEQP